MIAKRKKRLLIIASLLGLATILICGSLLLLRTQWFSDFLRAKIVAVLEDSTGGRAEIRSFRFEPTQLTARIEGLVIHGTEPRGTNPLVYISQIELQLKLFSSFRKAVDLAYLAIEGPRANLIVNSDGSTNIPKPQKTTAPSSKSPLATIVDLAVGVFRIDNGSIAYSNKTIPISLRGDNLRVLLKYNMLSQSYLGNIAISPLRISTESNPALAVRVDLPLTLERDAVRVTNSRLVTDSSDVVFDASLENLRAPKLSAKVHARLSLPEMQRSLNLPIHSDASRPPAFLIADLDAGFDQTTEVTALRSLNLGLGGSTFKASGSLNPKTSETIQFNSDLVLAELGPLFKLSTPRIAGHLLVRGAARLDPQRDYIINGTLASQNLSLQAGNTRLSNVSLSGPFKANPSEISLNPLRIAALGGVLSAKVLLKELRRLSVEGDLREISLGAISTALSGRTIGYGGVIAGTINAASDLQAKGASSLVVGSRLSISPRNNGIPVKGRIEADYAPGNGVINVRNSFISLPGSRVTMSGSFKRAIDVSLRSRNLNDFLPLTNFAGRSAEKSLPVSLQGGIANLDAQVQGSLAAPQIKGHAMVTKFAVAGRDPFDRLSFDLSASPSEAGIQNGLLSRSTAQAAFDGSIGLIQWSPAGRSPLSANLKIRDAGLGDLLALGGARDIQAAGEVTSDIHVHGTYGDPLGYGVIQILRGNADGQPFERMQSRIDFSHNLISLDNLDVSTANGTLTANGAFHHPSDDITSGHVEMHLRSNGIQLAAVVPLQRKSPGSAGAIQLTADAAAELSHKGAETEVKILSVEANLSAANLHVRNQDAGSMTAVAHTTAGVVTYSVKSNFAGSDIHIDGRTALAAGYRTEARTAIRALPVGDALGIIGWEDVPVVGVLTADATMAGTLDATDLRADLNLSKGNIYQEPVNRLTAKLRYTNSFAEISSLNVDTPAGNINLTGRYDHPGNLKEGSLQLRLQSGDLEIAKLRHVQLAEPGMAGTLHLEGDLAATIGDKDGTPQLQISALNGDCAARDVRVANRKLGGVNISAHTLQSKVTFQADSDFALSRIHASGESRLVAGYPTRANLTFANVSYANIAPFLKAEDNTAPPFDALVEGKATLDGPILNANALLGRLELSRLDVYTATRANSTDGATPKTIGIRNDGPIIVSLNKSVAKLEQFRLRGPKTSIDASGSADLANATSPLQIRLNGNGDLGILQDVNRKFFSSGNIALNANIGGTFEQPVLNGKVELNNANVNYADVPNGLSNGNGVILLEGTTATIQNMTGESGGGKIAVSGFVGLSPRAVVYNLRANATKVRTRYSGLSVTSSANVTLTGNSRRSRLGGEVTIERVAYSSSSDLGSILQSSSTPPSIDSTASPLLSRLRLDIRVSTASDVRVVTPYVERLDLKSALTVRGTAAQPGLLGYISVTDGQLAFFGNTYTVNRGSINFYDPSAIRPELDFSLETVAQGVDVVLGVTGPMSSMKLSYRSDPPLTFEQIVQLLATNTTPSDPTIAAHQPTPPPQSMSQMGESAVIGQAVASPLASRVQRVFGLTQLKIDPSVAGSNGQPTAKVTLQQKIANNITFTYITDVTQSNSEIVRIQWDLSSKASAVALRDYNGNVSLEMFYKFQVR